MDVFINQDTIGLLRLNVPKQFMTNDIDGGLKYFFLMLQCREIYKYL